MANLNGYPSIDRPTLQLEDAYSYFRRLRETYPGTEYAEAAAGKDGPMPGKLMAEHEMYVADFYFRMGRYTSSLARYRDVMREFKDVPEVTEHAELKAKASFIKESEQQAEKKNANPARVPGKTGSTGCKRPFAAVCGPQGKPEAASPCALRAGVWKQK